MARWPEWNGIGGREGVVWCLFFVQSRFRSNVLLCIRAADAGAGAGASDCVDEVKVKCEVRRAFSFTVVNFDTLCGRASL